ncbi:hypothetical protein BU26DRAFT_39337 [Trematosphaeria pertusa]|uniref:Uncharacterized protein n=1 Tax=Trematosphaeria pertusa TaxID=390896 RepID=A0A6A6J321_9PLEO|nr:uncharacterized protein BU26DRAFT_39337 [Trematosphaeria pertusa]KAF2257244.1 hypothetical protein BU26DRAFT_39337 [Trematosphaeria pertusa]
MKRPKSTSTTTGKRKPPHTDLPAPFPANNIAPMGARIFLPAHTTPRPIIRHPTSTSLHRRHAHSHHYSPAPYLHPRPLSYPHRSSAHTSCKLHLRTAGRNPQSYMESTSCSRGSGSHRDGPSRRHIFHGLRPRVSGRSRGSARVRGSTWRSVMVDSVGLETWCRRVRGCEERLRYGSEVGDIWWEDIRVRLGSRR